MMLIPHRDEVCDTHNTPVSDVRVFPYPEEAELPLPSSQTKELRNIVAAQLAVGILACEFPFDASSRGVPLLLPLRDFRL